MEDFAIALVDELEHPKHNRQRVHRRLLNASRSVLASLLESSRPCHEILKELTNKAFRRLVDQITLCIKARGSVADHHLRPIERKHIEEDKHLAQVILRSGRADRPDRRSHDRSRLS